MIVDWIFSIDYSRLTTHASAQSIQQIQLVLAFIGKGHIHKNTWFTYPCGALHPHGDFFIQQDSQGVFKDATHIYLHAGGEDKLRLFGHPHQCIQLVSSKVLVVHIDFAVHFFDIHPKTVGVEVHQIQFDSRLVKSQFINLDIPDIAVFERFGSGAGKGGAEANQ